MDDNQPSVAGRVGSLRKHPRPTGVVNDVDGDGAGEPASQRQRCSSPFPPSLTLLASCASRQHRSNPLHRGATQIDQVQQQPIQHQQQNSTQTTAMLAQTLINQLTPNLQTIGMIRQGPPESFANGSFLPVRMNSQESLNFAANKLALINAHHRSLSLKHACIVTPPALNFFSQATATVRNQQSIGYNYYQPVARLNASCASKPSKDTGQINKPNHPYAAGMDNGTKSTIIVDRDIASSTRNDAIPKQRIHAAAPVGTVRTTRTVLLWTPEDEEMLSPQQCWLRKQIETFPASARDLRTRGRNRLLDLGQVGIQCIHCKNLQEGRGQGSSYFPATIASMYQSAQNMLAYHFKEDTCPLIPRQLLQQMRDTGEFQVKCPRDAPGAGKSRIGGGKGYWERSALLLGLVDTTVGIRYSDDPACQQPLESIAFGVEGKDEDITYYAGDSGLTRVDDKGNVTDFIYVLMSQFLPYCYRALRGSAINKAEWESDVQNDEALLFFGIQCKFCKGASRDKCASEAGKHGKGIFLSSKADTMMRNKFIARLYTHLLECLHVPKHVKAKLVQSKNIHLPQNDQLKKGWKKRFFENICLRLIIEP